MYFLLAILSMVRVDAVQVPDPVYQIADVYLDDDSFYILDKSSTAIMRINSSGEVVATHKAKGQGPGEFQLPRCIAAGDGKVFVGDLGKILIFDSNLSFIESFKIPNNPRDIIYHKRKLYVSIATYPAKDFAVNIYNPDGSEVQSIYKHGLDKKLNLIMPYLGLGPDETLFLQPRVGFGLDQVSLKNNKQARLGLPKPVNYKDIIPTQPFLEKYGRNRAAHLHWRTHWTEPTGLAIVKQRYAFLCYEELQPDLVSKKYYLHIFDLEKQQTVASWIKAPGRLVSGGEKAWFSLEMENNENDDKYALLLKAEPIEAFLK